MVICGEPVLSRSGTPPGRCGSSARPDLWGAGGGDLVGLPDLDFVQIGRLFESIDNCLIIEAVN